MSLELKLDRGEIRRLYVRLREAPDLDGQERDFYNLFFKETNKDISTGF